MKSFEIPDFYKSPLIAAVKQFRKQHDPLKKNFSATKLDFGAMEIFLARHFGFCYGVENAIEIAFKTVNAHPGKRIFLLSEMIHNPQVNADLLAAGVRFIFDTYGHPYLDWQELHADDIVLIPAFGAPLETEARLKEIGLNPLQYNTTCPFVERVWNRSEQIGQHGYTIILHGKPGHEETRATFSHSRSHSPTLVIRDMEQARQLCRYINEEEVEVEFYDYFRGQYSEGFDPARDLQRLGVVNQTTMLATDTQEIADVLRQTLVQRYPAEPERFADTRDTLCYATNDNQSAVRAMLEQEADLALVVGGYNSSNTSHLVELCMEKMPTYFIEHADCLEADGGIHYFDFHNHQHKHLDSFLPSKRPLRLLLTAGASCPDALVEGVIQKLRLYVPEARSMEDVLRDF